MVVSWLVCGDGVREVVVRVVVDVFDCVSLHRYILFIVYVNSGVFVCLLIFICVCI